MTPERLLRLLVGSRWGVARLLKPSALEEDEGDKMAVDGNEEVLPRGRLEGVGFTEFMGESSTLLKM